ncbi:AI-2E family transporter [soil metagenome]
MEATSLIDNTRRWWWLGILLIGAFLIFCLRHVLSPFLVAAFLAYVSNPLVLRLMRLRLPRTLAVSLVFLLLIFIILLLILLLVPLLEQQINLFITNLPRMFAWLQQTALPWLSKHFGLKELQNFDDIKDLLATHWQQAGNVAGMVLKTVSNSSQVVFVVILYLILIPVVTFYLLRDWPKFVQSIKRLLPRNVAPLALELLQQCDQVLGAFFRGQLLVMLVLGMWYFIGLKIIGLDLALLIGVIAGLISIVPYLGFAIGLIVALIAAAVQFQDGMHVLYVLGVFLVGQIAEGMILAPLLVGDRIGLHPVAVIFAILAGGELFGFTGVLLALPAAAVIRVVLHHVHGRYLTSKLYKG